MARILFGLVVLGACGFLAVASGGPAEPGQVKVPVPAVPVPGGVDPKMPLFVVCAKACDDCARTCDMCAAHCAGLLADGKKEHLATLRMCQDCAAICSAAARVVGKDGPMSDLISSGCAKACKRCGEACDKFSSDPIMKQCADECRKCEKACREMAKEPADTPPAGERR